MKDKKNNNKLNYLGHLLLHVSSTSSTVVLDWAKGKKDRFIRNQSKRPSKSIQNREKPIWQMIFKGLKDRISTDIIGCKNKLFMGQNNQVHLTQGKSPSQIFLRDLCSLSGLPPKAHAVLYYFIQVSDEDRAFKINLSLVNSMELGTSLKKFEIQEMIHALGNKRFIKMKGPNFYLLEKGLPEKEVLAELDAGKIYGELQITYGLESGRVVNIHWGKQKVQRSKRARSKLTEEYDSEIKEIVSYLNDKSNKNFSTQTFNTRKFIIGRLKEGHLVDDFKDVIDNKVADWLFNPDMNKFLRPSTLFAPTKFESYLNEGSAESDLNPFRKAKSENTLVLNQNEYQKI